MSNLNSKANKTNTQHHIQQGHTPVKDNPCQYSDDADEVDYLDRPTTTPNISLLYRAIDYIL